MSGDAMQESGELFGYTIEELRELVKEGLDSGPSSLLSMGQIKVEARRRFEAGREHRLNKSVT